MDDGFTRRIAFEIEFARPDLLERERSWHLHLPAAAPVSDDVDYASLARQFALPRGEIRNTTVTAAFLAAHDRAAITKHHPIRAVACQRSKQGKLATVGEVGHCLAVVVSDGA